MTRLLRALVIVLVFEILFQLSWLATGEIPQRTPTSVAIGVAASVAWLIWSLLVLHETGDA